MPEITFNFNVNVNLTCDPAILNFLKVLQGVKPVEEEKKPVIVQGIPRSSIIKQIREREEKKKPVKERKYHSIVKSVIKEQVKINLLEWIKTHGPCEIKCDQKTRLFSKEFTDTIGKVSHETIRKYLKELILEGKILIERPSRKSTGRAPYIYLIKEEKPDNTKALSYFKEKLVEEYEEDEEDMIRGETAIEVPSPERRPRREIKRKCLKCGGQLWKRNTAEDNYLDSESRFMDSSKEIYYQCFQCGKTFKEKEFKEEAIAA